VKTTAHIIKLFALQMIRCILLLSIFLLSSTLLSAETVSSELKLTELKSQWIKEHSLVKFTGGPNRTESLNIATREKVSVISGGAADQIVFISLVLLSIFIIWNRRLSREINLRIAIEEKLKSQAEIINQIHDSVISTDLKGFITGWNKAADKLLGFSSEEMLGKHISVIYPPDMHSFLYNELIPGLIEKGFYETEVNLNKKSLEGIYVHLSLTLLYDEMNEPTGMIGCYLDVTKNRQTTIALEESERKFRLINSHVPGILYQLKIDANGDRSIPYVSPTIEKFLGLSDKAVMEDVEKWFELIHPEDLPGFELSINESMDNMTLWDWEGRFVLNNMNVYWFHGTSIPEKLSDGSIVWDGVFIDVSESKQSRIALEKSEERYRALAKVSPVGIFRTNVEGRCIYVNNRWCELAGMAEKNALAENWADALHTEDRERVFVEWNEAVKNNRIFKTECRFQRPDGKVTWLLTQVEAERDINGKVLGYVGAVTDISERKTTELALRDSETLLEKAQKIAQIGHWKLIPDTGVVTGSDELFHILGLNRDQATLDSFVEVVHPDDREMDVTAIQRGLEFGENWDIEHRLISTDNKDKWVHAMGEAIKDDAGNVVELLGTVQDISEKKLAEAEIEKNRTRFEAMFESIPDAIVYANSDRKIQMINSAAVHMFGYEETELKGHQTKMLYVSPDDFKQQGKKRFNPDSKTVHVPYEVKYKRKNGEEFTGETLGTPVKSSDGKIRGYLGIIRDVTEREHVNAILRSLAAGASGLQLELFLSDVLERLTKLYKCKYAFIGKLQEDGLHVQTLAARVNGQAVDNFEYALSGSPCQDVLDLSKSLISKDASRLYPEDKLLVDMGVESCFGAPLVTSEGLNIGILSVMDTQPLKIDEWTEPVLGVFSTRVSLELERDFATQELHRHQDHLQELVDERTSELILARDDAESANAAKSEFLSHMSHELRTPLNAILGFSQMLELDAEHLNETQQDNVQEILQAGTHLLDLINGILDLAKIESGQSEVFMEEVNVVDVVQQSLKLIKTQADARQITVIDKLSNKSYLVRADFTRLKQVLVNLLTNAVKYNSAQGLITLDSEVIDNKRLCISVTDTGDGLSEEEISKIFTPFERLNVVDNVEGTGIGLVITKHLIELMGGTITVKSTPGEGCTLWVELELLGYT